MQDLLHPSRRLWLCKAAAISTVAMLPWPASAQGDTVRLVSGFAAGGSVDALARITAEALGPALGRTAIVDSRTGAAGRGPREPERLATMRADWERWNATMPPIPEDASVKLGYSAKDMPQR